MKRRVATFVCLLNLIPAINVDTRVRAMEEDYKIVMDDLILNNIGSSQSLGQFDNINLEDKKRIMNAFKPGINWEVKKQINKCECDYQTADSVDVFTCNNGQTDYVLKILPLSKEKSFESEKLAFEILKSNSDLAKQHNIYFPIFVGSYEERVYYAIYEYAGENHRDSKDLKNYDGKRIAIWNSIVRQKCSALLFLITQKIMHCDLNYDNWIIQWQDDGNNVNVKVNLIDFGSAIKLNNNSDSSTFIPVIKSRDVFNILHEEAATNKDLLYLLNSLSYDLCDLLGIPHDERDSNSSNYGIFSDIKKELDKFSKMALESYGIMSLDRYEKLLGMYEVLTIC